MQLHQEMRSTLTTMQRIQEDLRRGVGLPNPRCAAIAACRLLSPMLLVRSPVVRCNVGYGRFFMESLEGSQPGSVPSSDPVPAAARQVGGTNQPSAIISAVSLPETVSQRVGAHESIAPQGVVQALPLPALRLEHFQTADAEAPLQPADAVRPSATSITDLTNFDHTAYAEFQALFDVPAGRSAPYLLPPDKSRGGAQEPDAVSGTALEKFRVGKLPEVGAGAAAHASPTEQLQDDIARRVQEYLRSEAGRTELARALHQLDDGET